MFCACHTVSSNGWIEDTHFLPFRYIRWETTVTIGYLNHKSSHCCGRNILPSKAAHILVFFEQVL